MVSSQTKVSLPGSGDRGRLLGPKTHLIFFTICEILVYFDRGLIAGLNLYLKNSLNLTDFEVGLLGGMFILGYVVASPIFAILGQISGVWTIRSICIGLVVWVIANILTGVVPTSFGLIVACRTLTGVGEAAFCSLAPPIIDDSAPAGKGSTFLGIFFMALYVGQALGYVGSGFFPTWESGQYGFLGEALLMIIVIVLALVWQKRFKVPDRNPSDYSGGLLRQFVVLVSSPTYMTLIIGYSAFMFAVGGFAYWGPAAIQVIWGASQTVGSMGFGALTVICGVIGTLLGGYILDVMSRKFAAYVLVYCDQGLFAGMNIYLGKDGLQFSDVQIGMLGGLFILGFVLMSPIFARIGQISPVWTIRAIYIGMILWIVTNGIMALTPSSFGLILACRMINGGGGSALVSLAPPILDDAAPPGKSSLYLGIFFVALFVGQALGFLIAGFFDSWTSGQYAFGVEAIIMIIFAFMAYWWERRFDIKPVEEGDERLSLWQQLLKLAANPTFICLSFGFSAFMFTVGGFGFWGPALIQYIFKTTQTISTVAFGAVTVVCGVVGTLIGGFVLDYLTDNNFHYYCMVGKYWCTLGYRWSLEICVAWLVFGGILWACATLICRNIPEIESMLKAGSYLMPVAPDGASEEETLVFESRLQLMYTLADIAGILRSHLEEPKPPTFKSRLLTALRLVRASQLSVEMDLGGLKAAVVVETLKLGIRLLLLVLQQDRSLLIDPAATEGSTAADEFIGARTGLRLPPMRTMQLAAAVPSDSKLNLSLPYPEDCLMMLRPLVYLGACSLVSSGGNKRADPRQVRDWGPWMVASGMDLLGVVILRERLRRDSVKPDDPREREYRRRVRLMVMGMIADDLICSRIVIDDRMTIPKPRNVKSLSIDSDPALGEVDLQGIFTTPPAHRLSLPYSDLERLLYVSIDVDRKHAGQIVGVSLYDSQQSQAPLGDSTAVVGLGGNVPPSRAVLQTSLEAGRSFHLLFDSSLEDDSITCTPVNVVIHIVPSTLLPDLLPRSCGQARDLKDTFVKHDLGNAHLELAPTTFVVSVPSDGKMRQASAYRLATVSAPIRVHRFVRIWARISARISVAPFRLVLDIAGEGSDSTGESPGCEYGCLGGATVYNGEVLDVAMPPGFTYSIWLEGDGLERAWRMLNETGEEWCAQFMLEYEVSIGLLRL
ncbi:Protein spinster 3 [Perkinsus chesapeaki]|uniref:Protein spinster 3 n=1 Tax=Perkinsus chesapeaki TaxID=330153 RepID=A0A7J6MM96_PERCH|nr:Protein spinster 3 [Perkinsus chesapeaki]